MNFLSKPLVSHSFPDGHCVVKLTKPRELLQEAKIMRNCLNDLDRFKDSEIYSLRSPVNLSIANIELRQGLLMQISGPSNDRVEKEFHPHIFKFLNTKGIHPKEVSLKLQLIEFNGSVYNNLEDCVTAFATWSKLNNNAYETPFARHPAVREFLNIFARHGHSAKSNTKKIVSSLFSPIGRSWRSFDNTIDLSGGEITIRCVLLPTALYHLDLYEALERHTFTGFFGSAVGEIVILAKESGTVVYDFSFANKIITPESFNILLDISEMRDAYRQARSYTLERKLTDLQKFSDVNVNLIVSRILENEMLL